MESELMSNLKLTNLKSFAKSSGHEGYPQLEEKDPMNLNLQNSTFYVDVTKKKYISEKQKINWVSKGIWTYFTKKRNNLTKLGRKGNAIQSTKSEYMDDFLRINELAKTKE